MPTHAFGRLRAADILVLIAMLLSVVATCLLNASRVGMWYDEITTWQILNRPSFSATWAAVSDLIGGPPVYFLAAAGWREMFGPTETTLRLMTAGMLATAFAMTWVTVRQGFSFWSTAFGLLAAFCTSWTLIGQIPEMRYYGGVMALTAVALWLYLILAERDRASLALLAANTVVHATLVMTHIYGGIYGVTLLGALVVLDLLRRRFRPLIYLSFPVGWAVFLTWLPAFERQSDTLKPHSAQLPPTPQDLTVAMGGLVTSSSLLLLALVVIAFLVEQARGGRFSTAPVPSDDRPVDPATASARQALVIGGVALACVTFVAFAISHIKQPVFLPRYLLPTLLGWGILFTYVAAWFDFDMRLAEPAAATTAPGWQRLARGCAVVYLVGLIAIPPAAGWVQPARSAARWAVAVCPDLPVVVLDGGKFMEIQQYLPDRNRYFAVLDWEAALDPGASLSNTVDYKILRNLKHHVPEFNIVQSEDFLRTHPRFLVDEVPGNHWVDMRLRYSDVWRISRIGTTLLLVERSDLPQTLPFGNRNQPQVANSPAADPCSALPGWKSP
jgi:hypothetical protein